MEKLPVKLVCFDMDGTLFGHHGEIPEINIRAIRECAARGIKTAIVSGRNFRFIMDTVREINENMIIVSANGARIDEKPGGKCLIENCFRPEDAREVLRIFDESEVYFEIYTRDVNYIFRPDLVTASHKKSLTRYLSQKQVLRCEQPEKAEDTPLVGIYKFVAFSESAEKLDKLRASFDAAGYVHSSSGSENVEVMGKGIDKGSALRFLSGHYGIPKDEIMAFGDFTNDLSLLTAAGYGVAMGNAVPELKQIASFIAPLNTEGGVGQMLYQLVL